MTYDFDNSLIQLIDKTTSTVTGITEGGLVNGDLKPFYARLTQKKGDGLVPSAVLSLYIQLDGKFVRTTPILIDKDAPDKYLIQIEMKQNGKASELQRYRLSTPTFTDDPDLGEIMQIPLESIAYNALKETRCGLNDELITPKQRVINILTFNNGQGGSQNVKLAFSSSDIDIPDNESLEFDYLPTSPKPIGELLDNVIDRIEQAGPLGGVFKNFFYDTFADPVSTNVVNIFFEEFGLNDSGVIIDPDNDQEASPNDKALMTSNKKRKKIALVKFGNRSGSLRMEHTRWASSFIHASDRPDWISGKAYLTGDVVKLVDDSINPNIIRFFTATNDVTSTTDPDEDNTNWFEDFTVIPPFSVDAFYEVDEVITSTETGSGGTGTVVSANDGVLTGLTSIVGGTLYTNGETVNLTGTGTGATGTVTVVSGVVTAVTIVNGGNGYTNGETITIVSTGTGTGASGNASIKSGVITSVGIISGGTNYTLGETVTLNGTGTGGTATVSSVGGSGDITGLIVIDGGINYVNLSSLTFGGTPMILFFFANTANGPSTTIPNLSTNWTSTQFSRPTDTYEGFTTYTPFTNDLDNAKVNLADNVSPPTGYEGYALDWNYERILNDIPNYTDRFKVITGKSVRRIENNPPGSTSRENYDGFRVLVGTSPIGIFVGHENQIAEFTRDVFRGISPHFEFSGDPVTNDTILLNHETGNALTFNGVSWVTAWTITDNGLPAPVHLVRSMKLVKGSSGIPGQALQYRFDWKDEFELGENENRTSRGAWYHDLYPKPISDSISTNLGGTYGGNGINFPANPRINHINLNQNRKGLIGYNRGLDSEDMGRITAHSFKTKLGIFRSSDDSEKSKGKKNIPMIYWRKDFNSRFFFKEFSIPENNEFFTVDITLPPFGSTNIYFNRIDELTEIYGYTLPFDFFIQEKEFSGVKYEFRKNDSWGYFMKGSYNDIGMYVACYPQFLARIVEGATQLIPDILEFINDVFTGDDLGAFVTTAASIDHTTLTTDEEYYVKEGYAIFPLDAVNDPRTDFIQMQEEVDYLTARAKANSRIIRNDFYPNERHVAIGTNLDIKYGEEVTETGSRVPNGSLQSVVSYMEQVYDNKGTNTRLFLVRKFTITEEN